jgi:TM2 domain-containing membrane protein YozV
MDTDIAATQVPLTQPAPAAQPAMVAPTMVVRNPKSPILALVLSVLLPGIGQIYNGQPAKAFAFFFSFVGAIWMCAEGDPMPFALLIPFVYFYGLVDAYASAALQNARHAAGGVLPEEDSTESPAWGWTLVAVGAVLLLNNLGWLPLFALRRFWPLLLIAAGLFFAYRSIQRRNAAPETGRGDAV